MMRNSALPATSDFTATLAQAAIAFTQPEQPNVSRPNATRPIAIEVVTALLAAEKTAKQERLSFPFEPFLGKWRLCFATGTRKVRQRGGIILGKGYYWFKFLPAYITFTASSEPGEGNISNQVQLGSLHLKFAGPCRYLGKKNLLAFDFTELQIIAFGRTLYQGAIRSGKTAPPFATRSIATLPFFAFFSATPDYIAARGRGGGLALWVRES